MGCAIRKPAFTILAALIFAACGPTPDASDSGFDVMPDAAGDPDADIPDTAVPDASADLFTDAVVPADISETMADSVDAPEATGDPDADAPADSDHDVAAVRRCNGMAGLCDRPIDRAAFVTTHNSMANDDDGFAAPNQAGSVSRQLADGVRAFMLDIHYDNTQDPPPSDTVYLCHGVCILGMRPLADTLVEMRTFLEENPDEFVAIIFESYVSAQHAKVSFDAAGVTGMLADLSLDEETPTMADLIDSGKRILVLTDSDGGGFPGYLPVWDWAWDNDWDNKIPDDLNCDVNRGSGDNRFFILNHFLTDPVASPELAAQVNCNPFFQDQADECAAARGHIPNFVTVDFYDIGDVFAVVDALNAGE